ncbi:MAG: adenylate/guanylate cyclase domain-containing protein, partial [Gaiellaceae bacterium]
MPDCAACGAALPAGARFCPACAEPVEAPAPSEERKLATVLFADLVGSTQLADGQDPERTRVLLDRFYEVMAAEVEAAGGTVEKFAGDAVMAAFGAPTAYEDHAERALHAALSMRRRLEELFGDELALRIGVNTGEVVVGRAREGGSFVTGDAVNVAARLEQAAAQGEILVGERTAAVARGAFEFAEPLRVEAKGKPGGVAARRLVRALSLMRPRGVGGLRRAFVGRESELDLLRATYGRAVAQGRPHLVTIMGEAGVGKTRLVREFWERLGDESPQPVRRTGRCLPYGRGITYWPLGEILKEHLGLLESDPADTVRARLGEREILGLALGLDIATGLHP